MDLEMLPLRLSKRAFLVTLLAGCSVVENPTLVEDLKSEPEPGQEKYRILPGDELEVRFFHTPNLNVTLPVRPDGFISLPYVQEMEAAGKTAEELSQELVRGYARVLKEPEITVIVRTFSSYRIHVGGRVDKPGVFPLTGSLTILDAIFQAGGSLPEAFLSQVVIIRKKPDSSYRVITINLERVLDGTNSEQNIPLHPYDAVYVPSSPIGNINTWVDLYIRRNIPIQFGIRPDIPF